MAHETLVACNLGVSHWAVLGRDKPVPRGTERNPEFAAATLVTDENYADIVLASQEPVVLDCDGDYCTM